MSIDLDFELYKGKKFSGLLKDIVVNREARNDTMESLIEDLKVMVKTPNDALLIIPLIREYLDATIKNDEQLIKLAAIVQRLITSTQVPSEDGSFGLSEDERKQLMEEANTIANTVKNSVETPTSK